MLTTGGMAFFKAGGMNSTVEAGISTCESSSGTGHIEEGRGGEMSPSRQLSSVLVFFLDCLTMNILNMRNNGKESSHIQHGRGTIEGVSLGHVLPLL